MHEISRRTFMGGSAAALFLLTGCSPQQAASSKSFPVSINHHFGTTTIPSKPKRVIAVGLASADLCVALGVVPVMIPTSEIHEFRTTPWFDKGLAKLNAALPETYQDIELPIRKFAQYKPDLILAVNSSITGDQYRQLSELAPVVAYADVPGNTDWRTSTLMAATALGTDKGEEVIAGTENSISKAAIPFADFSALTAMFFVARGIAGAAFELYGADTNPQRILGDYGVQRSPTLGELEEGGALTSTQVRSQPA